MMPFEAMLIAATAAAQADTTAPWRKTALFLTAETTLEDKSLTKRTIRTNGSVARNTSVLKNGIASLQFDGSGDFVNFADSADWNFGTGLFTVRGWFRFQGKNNNQALCGQWDDNGTAAGNNWFLFITNGALTFRMTNNSDCAYNWAPTMGQFYHIAISRDASKITRMFIDGVLVRTVSQPNAANDSGNWFTVGRIGAGSTFASFDYNGYMVDVEVIRGACLYTANFTPSSAPSFRGPTSDKTYFSVPSTPSGKIDAPSWSDYRLANKVGENNAAYIHGSHSKSSGKWRFIFRVNSLGFNTNYGVGLSGVGFDPSALSYLGNDNNGIGWHANTGSIHKNNVAIATPGSFVSGDMLEVLADLDANKVWFRKNGVVTSGDPAAGTGGYDISSLVKPIRPTAYMWSASSAVHTIFGDCHYDEIAGFGDWTAV